VGLQSKLFRADPNLEAAAVSDPAHIVPGASGAHVGKLQMALVVLDSAVISPDEMQRTTYGPSTAGAVLTYKQKRSIVNKSYQTQADNIVGKMTMARLDADMVTQQSLPRRSVQITPLSAVRVPPPRSPSLLALLNSSQTPRLSVTGAVVTTGSSALVAAGPSIQPGPNAVLELRRHSAASFTVSGGLFGEVTVADPSIARIVAVGGFGPASSRLPVLSDPQDFKVVSGTELGRTTITASTLQFLDGGSASLDVVVKTFSAPPKFVRGVDHGHRPTGRYKDVQANPNSGFALNLVCPFLTELQLVNLAKQQEFQNKPIALRHLDFYLTDGKGADFNEDANIKDWLTRDSGIKRRLKRAIFPGLGKPRAEGHFTFDQGEYGTDDPGQDFRFAFGGIDRVDFEVDFSQDTVRVFFQDRYEWHPVYPFYSLVGATRDFPGSGDVVRDTNCLHAALVELKSSGAADFWMKGQAEVSLKQVVGP
jgi:hypothetical protein